MEIAVNKLAQKGEAAGKEEQLPLPASAEGSHKADHSEEELPTSDVDDSGSTCS